MTDIPPPLVPALVGEDPLLLVIDDERLLAGLKTFLPGDEFPNHLHESGTETFVGICGELELWLDRSELVRIRSGTVVAAAPHREHYLRNASGEAATILYVRAPHLAEDRVPRPWRPDGVGH